MRILIFGAGAIGSAVGGLMMRGRSRKSIHLLGRERHISRIGKDGLEFKGIWGDFKMKGFAGLYTSVEEIGDEFDVVILSVKAYDIPNVLDELVKIKGEPVIISFQNGIGNMEMLCKRFLPERIGGARVIFGAVLEEPGKVRVSVCGGPILVGTMMGGENEVLKRLIRLLAEGGIPSEFVDDIKTPLWEKALYNSALNPLSAILKRTYGELADDPATREIMKGIIDEGFKVAIRKGAKFNFKNPDDFFRYFLEDMIPPTREHKSSMLQDIERGKKTEIDALCGAIVNFGEELNIPTPVNRTVYMFMKTLCS